MKPSFIIIGGVKCASSSLYRYLNDHPNVLPCKTKEPGFFNQRNLFRLLKGYRSYLKLYPTLKNDQVIGDWLDLGEDDKMHASTFAKKIVKGQNYITGEATANSMVNANPKFVNWFLPNAKLIALFRDPTFRFISHYNMFMRFNKEGRKGYDLGNLESFVDQEIRDYLKGRSTKILEQGLYIKYIPTWEKYFKNRLLLIPTEDLQGIEANNTLNKIARHLNLPYYDFSKISDQKFNSSKKVEQLDVKVIDKLNEFYNPFNDSFNSRYNINFKGQGARIGATTNIASTK